MQRTVLLSLYFFCISFSFYSQVTGKVTDTSETPLPFVNIYLEGTYTGTTSNSEGLYELDINKTGVYEIVFQYLGYTTIRKNITISSFPYTLDITLTEETTSLDEVIVATGVNPADRVVRAAIANRKANLDRFSEYTAQFYSRGLWKVKDAPEKILGQEIGDLGGGLDSTRTGIIYLSETISEIAYQRPNNFSEKITASKVSGNDNGFSFNSAIDANFSFYENTIALNAQIVSPIANNAYAYYRYKLVGTFFENGKLINKIEVTPRRPKDRVFSGLIYIVEDDWQVYGVELETTGEAIQVPFVKELKFKQNFSYDTHSEQWIKLSQAIDFSFAFFGIKGDGHFTAVYSDYNFNPEFTRKSFTNEVLSFVPEANKKDSLYWEQFRPVPLTSEESEDYLKKDSIQVIRKSQKYLDSIDERSNKFKLLSPITGYSYSNTYKRWRLSYNGVLGGINFNTVQGWHGETGVSFISWSDDDFQRFFSAFAKANYGFSDDRLRYTGGFTRRFNRTNRSRLSIVGGVEARAFNTSAISEIINTTATLYFERNFLKLYERSFIQANYSQELFNGINIGVNLSYEGRNALLNTTDQTFFPKDDQVFTSNDPLAPLDESSIPFVRHNIVKGQVSARINFDQKYYNYPIGKFNISDDRYPTLFLAYETGLGATEDDFNFNQLRVALRQGFDIGSKGRFNYNLKAGTFLNTGSNISFVDFQHFNGNQTRIGTEATYINRFNLLPYYDLSTNQSYFEGHVEHDFKGWILGKIPGINQLNFNLVVGAHVLSTQDNTPYSEFSIGIDNLGWGNFRLLRVDYVKSYGLNDDLGAFIFGLKFLDIF